MYRYNVEVTRIVDGDTVDVDIDLGFGMVYKKQRVRMMGIDTPESRTRDLEEKFYGLASKAHLTELLKDQKVQLQSYDKGKFGRIMGELWRVTNFADKSLNQYLVEKNHAVPYYGQSKDDIAEAHLKNREVLKLHD